MKPNGIPPQAKDIICPICSSPETKKKKGYEKGEFQLHICSCCGTGFVKPFPSAGELQHYYSEIYPLSQVTNSLRAKDLIHKDTEMVLNIIKQMNPEARRVCETGCGYGSILAGLRNCGLEVKGFELSEPLAAFAQEKLGLEVQQGEMPFDLAEQFDVVIERHLLEHTLNPDAELKKVMRALSDGGILILVVPNFGSLASRICREGWQWFGPPAHLYYFDNNSIVYILDKNGFKVEKLFTRRGDASNIILMLIESMYTRARASSLPPGFWKGSNTSKGSRTARTIATGVAPITEALYNFGLPFFRLIDRRGGGEELWCIARRS